MAHIEIYLTRDEFDSLPQIVRDCIASRPTKNTPRWCDIPEEHAARIIADRQRLITSKRTDATPRTQVRQVEAIQQPKPRNPMTRTQGGWLLIIAAAILVMLIIPAGQQCSDVLTADDAAQQCRDNGGQILVHTMSGREICDADRSGDMTDPDYFLP